MRLTHELPERTYMWGGMPHLLPRVSFGVAAFPEDGLLADQLIAKADETTSQPLTDARASVRQRVSQIMSEEKVDEKAALKKVAKELGVSKSEAYRELQRSK